MNRAEHLFSIFGEEGAEIAQRTSKVNRFGVHEIQPGQDQTNSRRLVVEYADVLALAEMLQAEGLIRLDSKDLRELIEAKKRKVEEFLKYSAEQGTLK